MTKKEENKIAQIALNNSWLWMKIEIWILFTSILKKFLKKWMDRSDRAFIIWLTVRQLNEIGYLYPKVNLELELLWTDPIIFDWIRNEIFKRIEFISCRYGKIAHREMHINKHIKCTLIRIKLWSFNSIFN